MIGIIFQFGGEIVEVRIDGSNLYFKTSTYGSQFVSINHLKLSHEGVIKEHPDLVDKEDWKDQAIARLKDKLNSMSGDTEKAQYVIKDLAKFGYEAKYIQRAGSRVQKVNMLVTSK